VNLVKPFNVRVVLDSKSCTAGEVLVGQAAVAAGEGKMSFPYTIECTPESEHGSLEYGQGYPKPVSWCFFGAPCGIFGV
jgi:hypothetical protein